MTDTTELLKYAEGQARTTPTTPAEQVQETMPLSITTKD